MRLLGLPTMRWAAFGTAAGLVAAVGASKVVESISRSLNIPPDATRFEPQTVAVTAAIYLVVVAAAVAVPAARALRVAPATILRAG